MLVHTRINAHTNTVRRHIFTLMYTVVYVDVPTRSLTHSHPRICRNATNGTQASACLPCPAGLACPAGTGGTASPPVPCAAGHFCPPGTGAAGQNPCPPGTYSIVTNASDASQCMPCPPGVYCLSGASGPTGACAPGHYCPAGSYSATT